MFQKKVNDLTEDMTEKDNTLMRSMTEENNALIRKMTEKDNALRTELEVGNTIGKIVKLLASHSSHIIPLLDV